MGRGEAPGSDLLREHRRLLTSAGEHAKQLDTGMGDDLFGSPLRRHVEGLLVDLRELWRVGGEWERDRNSLAASLNEANAYGYQQEGEAAAADHRAWAAEHSG